MASGSSPKSDHETESSPVTKEENNKWTTVGHFPFESLEEHKELTSLIWGSNIKQDLFDRWSQGFIFDNKKEPTALLQFHGGPCAVIAAVQAFILRELLFGTKCCDNWRKPSEEELNRHFADALLSIFINVASEGTKYLVFHANNNSKHELHNTETNDETNNDENAEGLSSSYSKSISEPSPKRIRIDYNAFTKKLIGYKFETLNELKVVLYERISDYKQDYGVLSFLYSLLLTKNLETLQRELEESGESLIDPLHGHGSQCLTNLMLCGIATSNVFDGNKSLEGLQLKGIPKQSTIGFLTIMEYLRYCEVGWYLKNPKTPIWILASETHLTVFFSQESNLIQKNETNRQIALKSFQRFDPFDNGFVKTEDLEKLMESLELLTDKEYIDVVKQQLDTENLGIITQTAFLNEFYPQPVINYIPDTFSVYHYNGLVRQSQDNEVQYSKGTAKIIDFTDQPSLDINSIKNCLQTKWPTIEIDWIDSKPPSLN